MYILAGQFYNNNIKDKVMSKTVFRFGILTITLTLMLCSCGNSTKKEKEEDAQKAETEIKVLEGLEMAPDYQYMGYRVVHHMTEVIKHIQEFGFNTFDHPRIADYTSFVITPALDHFYSKAVVDVREQPAVVETAPKDDRYSSIQIFDMEHHTKFDKVTSKEGERFVIVHEDYKGDLPEGTVVKVNCNFPFVFIRTQSFNFNDDKKADEIRRQNKITGANGDVDLPDYNDTQALLKWTLDNEKSYPQTKKYMEEAIAKYTPEVHAATKAHLVKYLTTGEIKGNPGMFEDVDDPAGGNFKIRAAGALLGHLGFPVHHAYYQNVAIDREGNALTGKEAFKCSLPYDPGLSLFWSVTRYSADNRLPLNPAEIGGNDIQAYNAFNTEPNDEGMVDFTFSIEDPKDGSYWMPVTEGGYYFVARYYGPTPKLNGNTAFDIIYKGTDLENTIKAIKF